MSKQPYRRFFTFETFHLGTQKVTEVRVPKSLGHDAYLQAMKQFRKSRWCTAVMSPFFFRLTGISDWDVEVFKPEA